MKKLKKKKAITMISVVIAVAILIILAGVGIKIGLEDIQRTKKEEFKIDAGIVESVIDVVRLKIDAMPDATKNAYLARLTIPSSIDTNELNVYLKNNSVEYTKAYNKIISEGKNFKFIALDSLKSVYQELTGLEFRLNKSENMTNIVAEYHTSSSILLKNKAIKYMGEEIRIVKK